MLGLKVLVRFLLGGHRDIVDGSRPWGEARRRVGPQRIRGGCGLVSEFYMYKVMSQDLTTNFIAFERHDSPQTSWVLTVNRENILLRSRPSVALG